MDYEQSLALALQPLDISEEAASKSIASKIAEVDGLFTFPAVAAAVTDLFEDDNFDMKNVAAVINRDPAMASKILRVANSAAFSRGDSSDLSLEKAVVKLGRANVTEALYSVATMGLFPNVSGYALDVRDHSASCGAICRQLASDLDPVHIEGAFLSGLMHDIGKLLLIASKELIYFNAESSVLSLPESSIPLERFELGYDHGVLTGQVLWKWNIPSPVPQVVALHHLPVSSFKESEFARLVSIVRVASVIDRQLMYSFTGLSDLISKLVNSDDGKLINLDEKYLEEHWTKFLELRTEALMVFK